VTAAPIKATPTSNTISITNSVALGQGNQLVELEYLGQTDARHAEQRAHPQKQFVNVDRRGHLVDLVRMVAEIGQFLMGYVRRRRLQEELEKHPVAFF